MSLKSLLEAGSEDLHLLAIFQSDRDFINRLAANQPAHPIKIGGSFGYRGGACIKIVVSNDLQNGIS